MATGTAKQTDTKTVKIVIGCLVMVAAALWLITALLERKDIPAPPPDAPVPEEKPGPKKQRPAIGLAPRPVRLLYELIDALAKKDRTEVARYLELSPKLVDELVTQERADIVNRAKQANAIDVAEPKIEGDTALMVASFMNPQRVKVMDLAFYMAKRGGDEDWKVTKVEDQWYLASGKQAESRRVALGEDRKGAEQVIKQESNFESMTEVDPKKLDWLPGTTAEQKAGIEAKIKLLLDIDKQMESQASVQALVDYGKPAIPPLLNEFVGLDVRHDEDVRRGYLIDKVLTRMARMVVGYSAGSTGTAGVPPAQIRVRAIRRWFGWWHDNKNLPLPTIKDG
jgi:hypothetical protein